MNHSLTENSYSIDINATPELVWQSITNAGLFAQWASAFAEGSRVTGQWEPGQQLQFTDGDGNGMISDVVVVEPLQTITLRCAGTLVDGKETVADINSQPWLGALENYEFTRTLAGTTVKVTASVPCDYAEYFDHAWPEALHLLKHVTELIARRMVFINLPVANLPQSIQFFSALGFSFNSQWTDETATSMIVGERTFVMLLTQEKFQGFIPRTISDARTATEVLTCLSCASRNEVDEMVAKAVAAGGNTYNEPVDYGFMYSHGFQDLDGHIWELVAMQNPQD